MRMWLLLLIIMKMISLKIWSFAVRKSLILQLE